MPLPSWTVAETLTASEAGNLVIVVPVRWASRWRLVVEVVGASVTSITHAAAAVGSHFGPAVAGLPDGASLDAGDAWGLSSSDLDAAYALRLVISLDGAGSVVVTGAGLA